MLRIGITGGIGSGKSTIARIFNVLGIPVYDADAAAKRLMAENEELKSEIKKTFGKKAFKDGLPDRKFLAAEVFPDSEKLVLLNALVHPATIRDAEEWMQQQNAPYLVKEAALIFESGSQKHLDFVIGVKAPHGLRLERAMQRDQVTAAQVEARMSRQMDEEMKMRLCKYVIVNDEQQLVIPQVLQLHEKFLKGEA